MQKKLIHSLRNRGVYIKLFSYFAEIVSVSFSLEAGGCGHRLAVSFGSQSHVISTLPDDEVEKNHTKASCNDKQLKAWNHIMSQGQEAVFGTKNII